MAKKQPALAIIAAGFTALVTPEHLPEALVNEDVSRELERNHGLRESSRETQEQYRTQLRKSTAQRARLLRDRTLKSFLLMISSVGLGWLFHAAVPSAIAKQPVVYALLSAFTLHGERSVGWDGRDKASLGRQRLNG